MDIVLREKSASLRKRFAEHGLIQISGHRYEPRSRQIAAAQFSTEDERTIFPFSIVCTSIDMILKRLPSPQCPLRVCGRAEAAAAASARDATASGWPS